MDWTAGRTCCLREFGTLLSEAREVYIAEYERCAGLVGAFVRLMIVIDYGGISASRLEALEARLKDDVIAELNAFGGRLVIHLSTAHKLIGQ